MKEGVIDVELMKMPTSSHRKSKKGIDSDNHGNMSKNVYVVNAF
jgi:hypothetical protein